MTHIPPSQRQRGMTLIEVVIFVIILSVILIGITSLMTSTSRRMRTNYHKLYANQYAQEAIEWLRVQKENSWQQFYATMTNNEVNPLAPNNRCLTDACPPGSRCGTYCLNSTLSLNTAYTTTYTSGASGTLRTGTCTFNNQLGTSSPRIFRREVCFIATNQNEAMQVRVGVGWQEGTNPFTVVLDTFFTGY